MDGSSADGRDPIDLFILAATANSGHRDFARAFAMVPGLRTRNFWSALTFGSADVVAAELARDPTAATRPGGPRNLEPILYVCMACTGGRDDALDAEKARIARLLIANGASPNAFVLHRDGETTCPLPALYGATGINDSPALARALLEGGADPNDSESVYHAAQHAHIDSLDVLHEFGMDPGARREPWGNTPLYFLLGHAPSDPQFIPALRGIQWLLAHGADPNIPSAPHGETPLHACARGLHTADTAMLLVRWGADPNQADARGCTPFSLAVRSGNAEVAEVLLQNGADESALTPVDCWLGCVACGDEEGAKAVEEREPGAQRAAREQSPDALCTAAERGLPESVRLLAEAGFALDVRGSMGGTPLHFACWRGRAAAARVLIRAGAPIDIRCAAFGATPLGWATHGSKFAGVEGDYAGIVADLLAAGADPALANNQGEPPSEFAEGEILEMLLNHSAGK